MTNILAALAIAALAIAALAPPAAAQVPAEPAAMVAANIVTHPQKRLAIRLPTSAAYAGSERFALYGVADAEVHVFVEADADKRMRRLWWVRFESYLPSKPELSYNYADGNRPVELGEIRTWLRSNPVPTTGPGRPGSDRELRG